MDWAAAHLHLGYVHTTIHGSDKTFFPYKTIIITQLAAVCFTLGRNDEGEKLCREVTSAQDWIASLRIENDFMEILQIFLKRRSERTLLAFEVMYFLRQF